MATIYGTSGNDNDALGGKSLIGTNSADTIYGFSGNDWLEGRNGNDTLFGDAGHDIIVAGNGNDYVFNGTGTGWLDGGSGTDWVDFYGNIGGQFNLGAGTARLGANGGAFTMINFENIWAGDGSDTITGSGGKNIIQAAGGNDRVNAGGGSDTVYGGSGNDTIDGGAGNDLIDGGGGDDTLVGGNGNDTFQGHAGKDVIDGGAGFDTLNYAQNVQGINADATVGLAAHPGSPDRQVFQSIEKIVGSGHMDYLVAGATTELDGNAGDDWVLSGSGANKLTGGAGIDIVSYAHSTAGVTVNLGSGAVSGGWAQGDTIAGFERLEGSDHADTLTGSSSANVIYAGYGNDKVNGGGADELYGGEGADELKGGNGSDLIFGQSGTDTLWGGSGADRFMFGAVQDSLPGVGQTDVIRDFSRSQGDKIQLYGLGGDLDFIGTAAFSAAGQVRFSHLRAQQGDYTIVEVNVSGNSGAEMAIQLSGGFNLQAGDFVL